jgi:hypothetical protein
MDKNDQYWSNGINFRNGKFIRNSCGKLSAFISPLQSYNVPKIQSGAGNKEL